MTSINCGVKLKSKKESLKDMRARFEELKKLKKYKSPEYLMLRNILEPRK